MFFAVRGVPQYDKDRSKNHFMRSKPPITVNSMEWISGNKLSMCVVQKISVVLYLLVMTFRSVSDSS